PRATGRACRGRPPSAVAAAPCGRYRHPRLRPSSAVWYGPRVMENVKIERDGPIATVTLNRPDRRTSLSDPMLTELGAVFTALRDDPDVRVVIVTGAPPIFSAGADAPISSKMSPEERRKMFPGRKSQFRRLFERANTVLENLDQNTIAMINGHAVGGG